MGMAPKRASFVGAKHKTTKACPSRYDQEETLTVRWKLELKGREGKEGRGKGTLLVLRCCLTYRLFEGRQVKVFKLKLVDV